MGGPLVPGEGTPKPIRELLTRARTSWLKNEHVHDILCNYREYDLALATEAPRRPPGGTVFLFNRKAIRFFRKDGHSWRKKQGGKTVRETHEKLKVGTRDMLTCYYAHSEEKYALQRRCYWLLEGDDSIVFVHYLSSSLSHPAVAPFNAFPAPSPTSPTGLPTLGYGGSRDLTGWQGRLGDSEDGGSDAVLPLQIGVVVTTPADSFEREPLPVTNSPDLRGPLDLLASPFSMPGQVLLEGPSSPSLQLHLDRATSATLARAGSANSARPALPEGTNRLGYLHEPAVRQGSIVQTGETKDKLPGPWEAVGVLGRVSSSHLDAPFARLNFDSRQSSLLRCTPSGLDVQLGAYAELRDEPQVVVTLSGAPSQPLEDGGTGQGFGRGGSSGTREGCSSQGSWTSRPGLRSSSARSLRSSDGSFQLGHGRPPPPPAGSVGR